MGGFSLAELMVVTAVIVLVSAVVLVNNNRFGGVVLLENLAYDIALSIRQAQAYGISVRRDQGTGGFNIGYGVYFNMTSPKTYYLFADVDGDGVWDSGEDVSPSPYNIERGFKIADLCVTSSESETCGLNRIDIIFKRPEPGAFIRASGETVLQDSARIVLKSPRDDEASVIVELSGQIATQ